MQTSALTQLVLTAKQYLPFVRLSDLVIVSFKKSYQTDGDIKIHFWGESRGFSVFETN